MLTKKQTCLTIPYSFSFYYSHFSHSRFQWRWTGRVRKLRGNERSLIVEKFPRDRVENENRGGRGLRGGTFSNDDWQTFITFRSEVKPKANRKTISDNVNLPVHATRGGVSRVCVCVCTRRASKDTRIRPALWIFCGRGEDGAVRGRCTKSNVPRNSWTSRDPDIASTMP